MVERTQHAQMVSLLQKYIENKCTEHELYILLDWLKLPVSYQGFDSISQSVWSRINQQMTLSDEEHAIALRKAADILLHQIKEKNNRQTGKVNFSRRKWIYRVAAVALIMLSVGIGYYLTDKPKEEQIVYKKISTNQGEIKEYTLKDGTHVILNSESRLIIPSDFNGEARNIEMIGEGFFEVAPNPDKPFIIKNENTRIKVLGTSFNIKAYQEDEY
ncbi:MAG: FecR family protein, partial [Dysgonamonadaceae bacterium]|nr:FecR family protein [Dysgonamonadaceae bacterium]